MEEKKDLREQTNPIFNTAKSMLLHLCIAGDKDAPVLAEKFGIVPYRGAKSGSEP